MFPLWDIWLITRSVSAANRGTTAGSSGDEIGKALASVSSFVFLSFLFNVTQKEHLTQTVTNSDWGKIGGLAFFLVWHRANE